MAKLEKIVRKLLCHAEIVTKSPLRIASGFDDGIVDILLLRDKQGHPLIPATSLAGVLQAELRSIYGDEACNFLFGCKEKGVSKDEGPSIITFSDIVLTGATTILRDGVKIDPETGTAVPGAKFDFEALDRGAKGTLQFEVTLRAYHEIAEHMPQISFVHPEFAVTGDVYGDMVATIGDLLTHGLTVGSLTSKGFGAIGSTAPVAIYNLSFEEEKAAEHWLAYVQKEQELESQEKIDLQSCLQQEPFYVGKDTMPEHVTVNQCIVTMEVGIKSALIVRDFKKESQSEKQQEEKLAAIQLTSHDDYVIPGSSIKGVLRNKALRITQYLQGGTFKDAEDLIEDLLGYSKESKSKKSRLAVNEVYISPNVVKARVQRRNRIDRLTGGTIEGALFADEPIWQEKAKDTAAELRFTLRQAKDSDVGLLLLLIRDIWLGNLAFGGNKSIGRGVLEGKRCLIQYNGRSYIIEGPKGQLIEGDKETLENCVQAWVGECHG